MATISSKWHPDNPNRSHHRSYENLIYAFLISMILSSIWTIVCRCTRNLRLALSLHSIVLSFWLMATLFDVYMLSYGGGKSYSFDYSDDNENNGELYLNIAFIFGVLVFHLTMFYFIDLFWVCECLTNTMIIELIFIFYSDECPININHNCLSSTTSI